MSTVPPFFSQLDLDRLADERAIRRAYASKVKLIDQEADPRGFQALREAYEICLQWARQGKTIAEISPVQLESSEVSLRANVEQSAHNSPVSEHAQSRPAIQQEFAQSLSAYRASAEKNLDEYRAFCREMVQNGATSDEIPWQNKLREILERPAFDSMYARRLFEEGMVLQLASGWKPGHETLFIVAIKVFRWREEPNRLQAFGQAGATVDTGVLEYLLFEDFRGTRYYNQFRDAIVRLRKEKEPSVRELATVLPRLEYLAQHLSHWLFLVADTKRLDIWRQKEKTIPSWKRKVSSVRIVKPAESASTEKKKSGWFTRIFFTLMIVGGINSVLSPSSRTTPTYNQPLPRPVFDPMVQQQSLNTIAILIKSKLTYKLPRHVQGNPRVEYRIVLFADGTIRDLKLLSPSGLPGFDNAVRDAILLTLPFPAAAPRDFIVSYSAIDGHGQSHQH